MIPFKQIPSNLRVPLFYAEVDNSQANSATQVQRTLIIGQILAAGIAAPNVPIISQGVGDAAIQGGPNSMLALMTAMYRQNDALGEVWYLPLADDPSAVAAAGSIAFTAAATANGTLSLYVGGVLYSLPITSAQTTAQIATALAALINADPTCPVTAAAVTNSCNLTADNKGPCGNDIDLRVNYGGQAAGQATPTGLAFTITAMTGGATAPSLTAGLANLLDKPFDFIVLPYNDSTSLNALQSFLNDVTGRWSWDVQIFGHCFAAYRGTFGAITTFGTGRNDQHATVMAFYDSPTPNWLWAAAVAGQAAVSIRADPAMPARDVVLQGVLSPPLQSRFPLSERNTLLFDGISTFRVQDDGTVLIEKLVTTYQKNTFGSPDNSYLDVETMFVLTFVLRALMTLVTSKYSRMKLAADGTRFASGSAIVTPNIVRTDLIAKYRELEYGGLVQGGDWFKANLIVQQNATNPNRLDVLWPGVLIDRLDIFALLAQFRLLVPAASIQS